jgi:hypothetical protein
MKSTMQTRLSPQPEPDGEDFIAWREDRPPEVLALARAFPIGTVITDHEDADWFVIGWGQTAPCQHGQTGALIISPVWPDTDHYDESMERRQWIHVHHITDGEATVRRYGEQ